jgi:signal peptidase II
MASGSSISIITDRNGGRRDGPQNEDALTLQSRTLTRRAVWAGAALTLALAIDFVTKWLIVNVVMVPPRTIEILPFFNLTLGFNTGVSFGMFRDLFEEQPLLLAGITVVIAAGFLVWAVRTTKRIETFALGLIAGGAVGNVVDRVRHGAVTDFLDFHVGDWHWPAFNMADVMITIGVVLLITGSLWLANPTVQERPSRAGRS